MSGRVNRSSNATVGESNRLFRRLPDTAPAKGIDVRLRNSPFQSREHNRENDQKEAQRLLVLDHIVKNHSIRHRMRFLGLPSEHWSFEHLLSRESVVDVQFIGVEASWSVVERSRPYMPGRTRPKFFRESFKNGEFTGFFNDRSRILSADLSSFLRCGRWDMEKKKQRKRWCQLYKSNTAAWLDFTSNICQDVCSCLKMLDRYVSMDCEKVPLCVSVMVGREPPGITAAMTLVPSSDPYEKRALFVKEMMEVGRYRRFEMTGFKDFPSSGDSNVRMLLVMGNLVHK